MKTMSGAKRKPFPLIWPLFNNPPQFNHRPDEAILQKVKTMNKQDLTKAIAAEAGETMATVEAVMAAFTRVTTKALREHDEVTLQGIAKFSTKRREARNARNPRTGEPIAVPAKNVVQVKVAKPLADHVA